MLKEEIFKVIDSSENIKRELIKSLLLPSLSLRIDDPIVPGLPISKVGGYPVISEEDWPLFNGKPLLFLAQVSLSEISHLNNLLPKEGFLCFFILAEDIQNRYPDRKGEFKVVYSSEVEKKKYGKNFKTIEERSISFFEFYTFPSYQENVIIENKLTGEELFFIEEIEQDMKPFEYENYDMGHQIFGHPKAVQGTVRFWWAVNYLGLENIESLSELEKEMVEQEESKFVLLLQLDFSDPKVEDNCFGGSVAYFGIHQYDLEHRNFDKVVLAMQNT